ncbi:MAG: sigma-54-dependent Fis family transcriptional regulator [Deltaproteobacteria bacterium]|nr:sigma-54-dependent Fis family transcriptional regulator [Deltaproteobacteria bacterium]
MKPDIRDSSRGGDKEVILIVDDVPDAVEVVRRNLDRLGYQTVSATSASDAVRLLEQTAVDLVITDYKMPQASGLELIRYIRENRGDTEIIMITGYASVEGAVEAMKFGASEYLSKPFTDEELIASVERTLDKLRLHRSMRIAVTEAQAPAGFIGDSATMRVVYSNIAKSARTTATVLVTGESGTGKELVARAIHYNGERAAAPFVAVNCGGIPESLLESELFGHVRGAFTGATESRAGFFQTADGGTVFLDEVSEMTAAMQVKLLRVLQEKEIYMVGSARSIGVDVRVIAATNKDLRALVSKNLFREDLFYRLNVISIEVPPLRARADDILKMIGRFAEKFSAEAGRPAPRFSVRALELLMGYQWPGNVRELENTIHRLVVMSDNDPIDAPDLPALMRGNQIRETNFKRPLAEVEAEYIRNVMSSVGGNKSRAAEILGIDRKTLREKLKSK